jgi:hypothetical protein
VAAPGIPQNFTAQTSNQQVLASWSLVAGATSYVVQRSLDNITYSTISTVTGSPLATQTLDTTVNLNTQYWYQVAATNHQHVLAADTQLVYYSNGANWLQVTAPSSLVGLPTYSTFSAFPAASTYPNTGISSYAASASAIPTPTGEQSLSSLRLAAKQRADRVNSQFVTDSEWRGYINQSMFELYDLLVTVYEDYFLAPPVSFQTNGSLNYYPLPNGSNTFTAQNGTTVTPPPFYKLTGVDLALNTYPNAYVTLEKFNFADRNKYVFPNSASSLYGVFNPSYRVMGNNIQFIPIPSSGQGIRLWYIPRLTELLLDTDTTSVGISGWTEYIIVKAAYYALTKEESDTSSLVMQLQALTERINASAANRDAGQPDTISDVRGGPWGNGQGGPGGYQGGF